jgi:hypothetical protein
MLDPDVRRVLDGTSIPSGSAPTVTESSPPGVVGVGECVRAEVAFGLHRLLDGGDGVGEGLIQERGILSRSRVFAISFLMCTRPGPQRTRLLAPTLAWTGRLGTVEVLGATVVSSATSAGGTAGEGFRRCRVFLDAPLEPAQRHEPGDGHDQAHSE